MKRREDGAALLSVLLLVAILSVMTAAAIDRLRLATQLTANLAGTGQARVYGYAAEGLALVRIGDFIQRDAARTTLAGDWNGVERAFPIDQGRAAATLTDGGNCFNLNSLVLGQSGTGFAARPQGITQFARLMGLVGVPPANAGNVATAAADWIDSDSAPSPGGAEDGTYQSMKPAYRTANTLMIDPSELRSVAGVTPEIYARVRPWICALPSTELSSLNVNTLGQRQAILLAMISPSLDVPRAERAILARPADGWASLTDFRQQPALAQLTDEEAAQLKPVTRWFNLRLRLMIGEGEFEQTGLIDGGMKPAKLVRRSYGEAA